MKRLMILAAALMLALTGCVSGKFLGFLATADYVDAQAKEITDKQAAEIEQLKAQLTEYQKVKDDAAAAVEQVNQIQERIATLPREVIQRIVDLLQEALKQQQ